MKLHTGVGLFELAARVLFSLIAASAAFAQTGKEGASNQAEEKFKEVDPYTKGDADLVRQAGYKSLRPSSFAQDIQAQDMLELLGGIELVWAETEHFKICSSLQTYKSKGDPRENAALEKELVVLTRKIPDWYGEAIHATLPGLKEPLSVQRSSIVASSGVVYNF